MNYLIKIVGISLVVLITCSCGKKAENQAKKDQEEIVDYLEVNNINAQKASSDIHYFIEEQGLGDYPETSSSVTVAYKGYLLDGTVFDESNSEGISFSLFNVIKGWQLGIPFFKEGGKGQLFIPSSLAYGSKNNGDIPKNSVLIFDIHLIEVL